MEILDLEYGKYDEKHHFEKVFLMSYCADYLSFILKR